MVVPAAGDQVWRPQSPSDTPTDAPDPERPNLERKFETIPVITLPVKATTGYNAVTMSLVRAVALNTGVQLVGRVATTVLSLVLIGALTRYLGVEAFGEYTTIFAYVAFFGVLADFGFFWIMVRELAKIDLGPGSLPASKAGGQKTPGVQATSTPGVGTAGVGQRVFDSIVSNVLTLRTFLGLGVFALGGALTWLIPQYSVDVRVGIAVIALAWLATALNSTFVGVFQNKLRMDKAVLTDVVGRAVILALVLWLITTGAGLTTILLAYVVGNWANLILSFLLGQQYVAVRPAFDTALWKRIFWEAFPMGVVLILHVIYFRIDSVMLSLMKGSTDVGIYGAPYKILEVLLTLPVMFLGNVFPTLTRLLAEQSPKALVLIQRSFDTLAAIALPLSVGGIVLAEPIIRLIAGQEFVTASTQAPFFGQSATAVLVLQILMVAVGVAFISNLFNYLMIALGRQRSLVRPYLVFGLTNVLLNLLVIPSFSYIGAALSTLVTELVVVSYLGVLAIKATKVQLQLGVLGRIAVATAAMAAFLMGVPVDLWGQLVGGVVVYGAAAYLMGVISPELVREIVTSRNSK